MEERPKRRRVKTCRYIDDTYENEEARHIQQALANSRREIRRETYDAPFAPTYYPTVEQFKDPLSYIESIRDEAEKYGVVKIVPPEGWNPPDRINFDSDYKMPTKKQNISSLQQGGGFDDGAFYTLKEYKRMADSFAQKWYNEHYGCLPATDVPKEDIARSYWDMVETSQCSATVEYANDLDTIKFQSGFPSFDCRHMSTAFLAQRGVEPTEGKNADNIVALSDEMFSENYYARTGWNLNILPHMKGSIIHHLKTPLNGINIPWLYVGMLFSTFCWHTEDNYLYSINYSHMGATKQWYGVPASSFHQFEKAAKEILALVFKETPDVLHHMTLQVGPSQLIGRNVPVYQIHQDPGTFVVTFPMAYHGGFSYGFNIGEAVNFAIPDWLRYGAHAGEKYRMFARPSVLNFDRLLFTIKHNIAELPQWAHVLLAEEIVRVINHELYSRGNIRKQGVREKFLRKNNFDCIDDEACDYDDKRTCYLCNQACIFSAVVCGCDNVSVSCAAHFHRFCKCPMAKKVLITWSTDEDLNDIKRRMAVLINSHKPTLKIKYAKRIG